MKSGWVASWSARSRSRAFHRACDAGDRARDRGDWSSAAQNYRKALDLDAGAHHIAIQLGHAHKEMGDYEAAAGQYYGVLSNLPTDDDLHLQIGHIEKLRGNRDISLSHYQRAAELNPKNRDALLELQFARAHSIADAPSLESEIVSQDHEPEPEDATQMVTVALPQGEPLQEPAASPTPEIASTHLEANISPTRTPISTLVARPPWADGLSPRPPQPNDFVQRANAIEKQLLH